MIEKRHKAAALRYNQDKDIAPKVTATGKGLIAEEIIQRATENNIPVMKDESLVEILAELNINESIPDELYMAVAEVFAFVYQADKEFENT
ncbi:EscU/YscU/HrcU family type III secretion system export apparatus switch protein [Oceanobacillus sp. 1P07AA]|uniref:EscU/YscU/HrcU family type III secretion system export apparatus switch protein n=1 Tax=Oceanobacillus sp. 1P07AA TaxID=3132293 RepID=UPI0039A76D5B